MSESLETRSPFLNHKLIETSWKIPFNMKISNKKGKYIIRKILSKYLPEKLFNYPKSGFSVPIGDFFLSNKKSSKFVEEILFSQTNKIDDLFNNTNLQNIWNTHKSNKINYSNQIWNIIMLKLWLNS